MVTDQENTNVESVMDYDEHERTYNMFIQGSKLLALITIALLIAMCFGFFAGGGLIGGTFAFIILMVIGYFFV
ncbi:MAG: aa3-type cytochrome c oxidase subunit IV [Pseudomonadota bacterium]